MKPMDELAVRCKLKKIDDSSSMMKKSFLHGLWMMVILVVAYQSLEADTTAVARGRTPMAPNIVYILADDLGYADVGFMGSKYFKTPVLDQMAHAGTILTSFYVQPVCSPTRASLMTGRYVAHTGMHQIVKPTASWGLPLNERLLPQALQEVGYETAIVGKWHLGQSIPEYRPTHRGFTHQYGLWGGAIDYFSHEKGGAVDWHRDDSEKPLVEKGYSTALLANEACRLIKERDKSKPFFLYLPFNAVHSPEAAPESDVAPFKELGEKRDIYAGMISAMDQAVGQVLAALDEQQMRGNTLIIFSSDNGGVRPGVQADNGPLRSGKGSNYEGGVRVSACVNWPGHIPSGKRISEPVHIIDWYPTLIQLAGGSLKQPLPIDGRDLWPLLTTPGAKSPHEAILLSSVIPGRAALRMGDWKLVYGAVDRFSKSDDKSKNKVNYHDEEAVVASLGPAVYELYNLAQDIGEKNDVAKENPEKLAQMKALLIEMLKNEVPFIGDVEKAKGLPSNKKSNKEKKIVE